MPSLRARLAESVALPVMGGDRAWTAEAIRARIAAQAAAPTAVDAPRWLGRLTRHTVADRAGWPVHELTSKGLPAQAAGGGPGAGVTVLYLHGGGYVNEMLCWHWYLLARLTRAVPARFVIPMYPVAPRGVAADVVPAVTGLLAELVTEARADKAGAARVVLMGDSAGGGLALAAAQVARDRGAPQPDRIALVSPWLDVTMTDPDQPALAAKDRMLGIPGLAEAGRCWAAALDPADPLASPLRGVLTGLAPLTVLCGTHDVLLPDSRHLAARAAAAGLEIDYHEAPGLPHCYPLFPIPEARAARAALATTLRGPGRDDR
ncbi:MULTISPECIES: alpha/beta hydrolase fold domain-containing protein [unclassified Pseudofrankia]|uniref:alpha/beta hydrolase fold domain-containing protein n=1 Tax=unclassified Pseudofrankia TaxID=2994372 RepID=UPI0008D9AE0E|nr:MULTISPECIES: alpha/beta hydrolase fold domain-containing protein [unclassified Pseudofrankia]MDT3445901.1 alpha/beta hydrolase fold domain-containing protein [Pseudofrankia sp. BMG5.37]OHV51368.1 esterase [Pseudofrankia sp. BMG5.36]